ncbi:hypothetical protein J1N35_018612 [Gossypium stocksii]|uniref:Uncharacterized protein n=1 Tax=Gossypium stocksii TaxID=47602 RepID=A0A9D3VRB5_9ROSI|nr:hypothetical protein J1N35_018612 [Gossypium stocksii]
MVSYTLIKYVSSPLALIRPLREWKYSDGFFIPITANVIGNEKGSINEDQNPNDPPPNNESSTEPTVLPNKREN